MKRGAPRIRVQATNLLDDRRSWPAGYSYLYFVRDGGSDTLARHAPTTTRSPPAACTSRSTCGSDAVERRRWQVARARWRRLRLRLRVARDPREPAVLAVRHRERRALPLRLLPRPPLRRGRRSRPSTSRSRSTAGTSGCTAGSGEGRLAVSPHARGAGRPGLAAAGVVASVGLGLFLKHRTDAALPFPDAATTAFSLVAQWMATRKWLENWLVWIAVDVAYVGDLRLAGPLPRAPASTPSFLVLAVARLPASGALRWRGGRPDGAERAPREAAPRRADRPRVHGQDLARRRAGRALRRPVGARARARVRGAARRGAHVRGRGADRAADRRPGRTRRSRGPRPQGAPLVVLDTDLVSTMVYSRHYYGDCPRLDRGGRPRAASATSTSSTTWTCAWVADGRQREQPERREELFARFRRDARAASARGWPTWPGRGTRAARAPCGRWTPSWPRGVRRAR